MMTNKKHEKGMALLLVLIIVTLLTSILMELSYSTLIEQRLTETFRDSTRAYFLARGGITAGQTLVSSDKNEYDAPTESWGSGIANYPVGEGFISLAIEDLGGKLALNSLVVGNNPQAVVIDRFYRLLSELEVDEPAELTAAVIDWLDSGDTPYQQVQTDGQELTVSGAENIYYQSLATPYACKNGPMESLEELLLVKGFTEDVFNIVSPYLSANGTKLININTATSQVLTSLSANISAQSIELITDSRSGNPVKTINDLQTMLAEDQFSLLKTLSNQGLLGTTSSFYKITAEAIINDGRCALETLFDKTSKSLSYIRTI
ncbi:type II secretion system minor pseudopilin GspK [uncultured Desulfuromusa sp.]|uniref:type II secretion system minor pseudopilin GspK n=1 Tax=uncultured Desulfuromusa sp. TaxID=219183 RepID=UPI002AA70DDC|nr:type II secretion system minor pseudopilin GspK [uncultured Desulfuromusa sp.]